MKKLYFDYNATTPVHHEVVRAINPYFTDAFGNPGCAHMHGVNACKAIAKAVSQVAGLINAAQEQIIFTSCATESNNLVLFGLLEPGDELIISAVEHPSIMAPAQQLSSQGVIVKTAPVNSNGLIDPLEVVSMITPATKLVSIMLANNETGAIQPVAELGVYTRPMDVLLHTDAAQAVGKIPVNTDTTGVDFLTVAGHKMYAPKGIGVLYAKNPELLKPMFFGGGQQNSIRPGTENVPYIAGLGRACELADHDLHKEISRQKNLGKILLQGLNSLGIDFMVHSEKALRLPNTLSIGFGGFRAGDILSDMIAMEISASAGAACHGNSVHMSSVLQAMKVPTHYGLGTIRFSWGRMTSNNDIQELLSRLEHIFKNKR